MTMDYVQKFDIELDKEIYYAGEIISGRVVVDTLENIKVKGMLIKAGSAVQRFLRLRSL